MKWLRFVSVIGLLFLSLLTVRADQASTAFEQQVAAITAGPQVTVVHLWAPWCSNCKTEMRPDGWARFVRENPEVKIVFVNIWHKGQNAARSLTAGGLVAKDNLVTLTHPNASNQEGEKVEKFLGMPVSWVPTTWVFRDGKLRYGINYGEVRFEMLQQMVKDARASW